MKFLSIYDNPRNADPTSSNVWSELSTKGTRLLFGLPFLVAACLYTVHLTSDLYGDEGSTFRVVSEANFLANLMSPQLCHPPLYFVAAKVCYILTGCPWSIRLPSLVCAFGTVVLVMHMAFRIYGRGIALLAVWLAALSPLLVEFAAEGRPYAMLAFFSTATVYQLLRFLRHEDWRSMLLISACIAGGLLTHYIFIVHVAFVACYYLFRRRKLTRYSLGALLIVLPVLALLSLGAMHNAGQSAKFGHLFPRTLSSLLNFLARLPIAMSFGFCTFRLPNLDFSRNVPYSAIRNNAFLMILVVLAFVGLTVTILRFLIQRREWVGFLFCSIAVPVPLFMLGVLGGCFLAREKYLIGLVGTYLVLVAAALYGARRSWILRGVAVAYLLVVVVSLVHYELYPNVYSRRMDWTGVRKLLRTEMAKGDVLIVYHTDNDNMRLVSPNMANHFIDLWHDKPKDIDLAQYISSINTVCAGKVWLIYLSSMRNWVDPNDCVRSILQKERDYTLRKYGRSLSLYVFDKYIEITK